MKILVKADNASKRGIRHALFRADHAIVLTLTLFSRSLELQSLLSKEGVRQVACQSASNEGTLRQGGERGDKKTREGL